MLPEQIVRNALSEFDAKADAIRPELKPQYAPIAGTLFLEVRKSLLESMQTVIGVHAKTVQEAEQAHRTHCAEFPDTGRELEELFQMATKASDRYLEEALDEMKSMALSNLDVFRKQPLG